MVTMVSMVRMFTLHFFKMAFSLSLPSLYRLSAIFSREGLSMVTMVTMVTMATLD